jgi:hypothetical protein
MVAMTVVHVSVCAIMVAVGGLSASQTKTAILSGVISATEITLSRTESSTVRF